MLIEKLFAEWEQHSRVCFETVYAAYQRHLDELIQDFFSKYTSGGLYDAVRYSFFRFLRDFCLVMSFLGI